MVNIADAKDREQALKPDRSFIVQAPAGSGKTELLTQRFLRLLATVENPEEIYAITFTRKAAGEMRKRIFDSIQSGLDAEPSEPHKKTTWQLARNVLKRDQEQVWSLLSNPNRLRIQTFDSLCQAFTKQMPLISELGASPNTKEDSSELYLQAALRTIQALEDDTIGPYIKSLLRHFDNNVFRLQTLIANMLSRRDQWLRYALSSPNVDALNHAIEQLASEHLEHIKNTLNDEFLTRLFPMISFALEHIKEDHPLFHAFAEQPLSIPGQKHSDLERWQALANWLLTQSGSVRKSVTAKEGFPAPSSIKGNPELKNLAQQAKADMTELLAFFSQLEPLPKLLNECRLLPVQGLNHEQSELLRSLLFVLTHAALELQLTFQEQGELDFTEVQLRALQALGTPEEPTDLALMLDYRIQHLLVDEFQDTSHGQYLLLHTLTSGWQPGDGRTLFLVGDPMQSIYRFREAEVGLYLRAREQGLGDIALTPLNLNVNFRSSQGVVNWVNETFSSAFPSETEISSGAVSYSSSEAFLPENTGKAVETHLLVDASPEEEALHIAETIKATLKGSPTQNIAVLGRSRSHLHSIAYYLKQEGIKFQAVEVDTLASSSLVQDLYSLLRALSHPADRLAWLSTLRAPWCGLSIEDLMTIAGNSTEYTIRQRLGKTGLLDSLSVEGKNKATRFLNTINSYIPLRDKMSLRQSLESLWLKLGGLAIAGNNAAAEATAFFELLEKHSEQGTLLDFAKFETSLSSLYAPPDAQADGQVQLMTMHKSKGLEFDTVILPSLARRPRSNESSLLNWLERPNSSGEMQLIMAPIKSAKEEKEPIANYLRKVEGDKDQLESTRLLYVAATRAKHKLHIFASLKSDDPKGSIKPPEKSSLLSKLWPSIEDKVVPQFRLSPEQQEIDLSEQLPEKCISTDWQPLSIQNPVEITALENALENTSIDFDWASDTARHVGTLVHRYLETIANTGIENWSFSKIDSAKNNIEAALAALGVAPEEMQNATKKTQRALKQCLEHDTGQWILSNHTDAQCEYPLTIQGEAGAEHYIIDRTFIDNEGTRWIIDYKTGDHFDDDIDTFLDNEKTRYQKQLDNYGYLFSLLEDRPTQLALYFPLLKNWRVWQYKKDN